MMIIFQTTTCRWDALFPAIFGPPLAAETQVLGFNSHKNGKVTTRRTSSSSSSSSSTSSSKLYCVKRASWGLGPRPFYTDFVEQVRVIFVLLLTDNPYFIVFVHFC
jgi:hypothetical protein